MREYTTDTTTGLQIGPMIGREEEENMRKIMLFVILIVMCFVTACTGTELNNTTTVSTSSAKTEMPTETPKPSVVPSPSVQESIEPSAVATTAEATPDNIPYKVEDFYGRWKIVKCIESMGRTENPQEIVGKYIYIYEDLEISYSSRDLKLVGAIFSNVAYEIRCREDHRPDIIYMEKFLEDDEEMPTYELVGLDGAIINENKMIWISDAFFLLEKDTSFERGKWSHGAPMPLYFSEIEIIQ